MGFHDTTRRGGLSAYGRYISIKYSRALFVPHLYLAYSCSRDIDISLSRAIVHSYLSYYSRSRKQ